LKVTGIAGRGKIKRASDRELRAASSRTSKRATALVVAARLQVSKLIVRELPEQEK
jgi:hypothetical protein